MQALLDILAHAPLPADARRLFHGRGGQHPGCEQWSVDWYPPALVITSFAPVDAAQRTALAEAIAQRETSGNTPLPWVLQVRQPGTVAETHLMEGVLPQPHVVQEDGASYLVHVLSGQNHGLFLDMAEGRRWVRRHLADRPGTRVLNLFAYTCAFSVAALQAGAAQVINVDMSKGALSTGQQNHQLNRLSGRERCVTGTAGFWAHDIFNSWGKLTRHGPYDLVIVDPPSYQKGSFVATKDYARLLRRLPTLLAPGGHALLCLNAPELGTAFLKEQMVECAPPLEFVERVANPVEFADLDPERSLKVLVYRAPADIPASDSDAPSQAEAVPLSEKSH